MANSSISHLRGKCIAPFLDASRFPTDGGFIPGRLCAEISELPGQPTCCLPCPATDWTYSDSFPTYGIVASWLNVFGLVLLAFMLLSYLLLPPQQTRKHYLSVCLVVSIAMIAIGFTIPLGADPPQCFNDITPNDMYSLMECAWSGALIIAGGLTTVMWIFIRALSMNLQICWDIVPGRKFFYLSQLAGWGIPAILFTIIMTLTGVSFRFGSACHVNHKDSMGDFWGPLLAFAGAAGVLQLMTFGYCIRVYLKNLWSDQSARTSRSGSMSNLPSHAGSLRAQTARAVYQRLKKVLWLQWRGICIVSIILIDVVFFSTVFVYLDAVQHNVQHDLDKVMPWLTCLAVNPDDKNKCLPLVQSWLVNESTVIAVLMLLSLAGLQVFLLLTRPSVFPAWWRLLRGKLSRDREFVSLDARPPNAMRSSKSHHDSTLLNYQHRRQSMTFEMQSKPAPGSHVVAVHLDSKEFSPILRSPSEAHRSPGRDRDSAQTSDDTPFFPNATASPPARGHIPPEYAGRITPSPAALQGDFSPSGTADTSMDYFTTHSRPPAVVAARDRTHRASPPNNRLSREGSVKSVSFDARETYFRGGLALNPPSEAGESEDEGGGWGRRGQRPFDARRGL